MLQETIEELFPSYIFSKFDPGKHIRTVNYTRGIRRIVGDGTGSPYVMDEAIIENIRSRIKDGFVQFEPVNFDAGDDVIIREGPLKGLRGVFQKEVKAQDRVVILLNTLAYQARIEVAKEILAKD